MTLEQLLGQALAFIRILVDERSAERVEALLRVRIVDTDAALCALRAHGAHPCF
jgi:hypothetical protein